MQGQIHEQERQLPSSLTSLPNPHYLTSHTLNSPYLSSSEPHDSPMYSSMVIGERPAFSTNEDFSRETFENGDKKKIRRKSFIDLEQSQHSKIQKMIRSDGTDPIRMSMIWQDDETNLCSSIIYAMSEGQWKNREVINLTTKRLYQTPIQKVTKVKIKKQEPLIGYKLFKFCTSQENVEELAIRKIDLPNWYSNTIWLYLVNSGYELPVCTNYPEVELEGLIYKKSEFLGKWEPRLAKISESQGFSCWKEGCECSPSLKINSTQQLWTRLEVLTIEGQNYLIFKFWYMMWKMEIAIPVIAAHKWAHMLAHILIQP